MLRMRNRLASLVVAPVFAIALALTTSVLWGCSTGASGDMEHSENASSAAVTVVRSSTSSSTAMARSASTTSGSSDSASGALVQPATSSKAGDSSSSRAKESTGASDAARSSSAEADDSTEAVAFAIESVPVYEGVASVEVNGNMPYFQEADLARTAFEEFTPLDRLGRCGVAFALVGPDTMPVDERRSIGMVRPSGWHTQRYDWIEGGYLYNRCHLIGYQLTGQNDNELNLITGTRTLNTVGMLPYEERVASYVRRTGNHVLYRSTPVFAGDELVARGVLLEALSVEDGGRGVRFCSWCYNIEPGVDIDYATGESCASATQDTAESAGRTRLPGTPIASSETPAQASQESASMSDGAPVSASSSQGESGGSAADPLGKQMDEGTLSEEPTAAASVPEQVNVRTYVLNKNTHKFHYPDCSSVRDMAEHNKEYVEASRDDVVSWGFSPCGRCNP